MVLHNLSILTALTKMKDWLKSWKKIHLWKTSPIQISEIHTFLCLGETCCQNTIFRDIKSRKTILTAGKKRCMGRKDSSTNGLTEMENFPACCENCWLSHVEKWFEFWCNSNAFIVGCNSREPFNLTANKFYTYLYKYIFIFIYIYIYYVSYLYRRWKISRVTKIVISCSCDSCLRSEGTWKTKIHQTKLNQNQMTTSSPPRVICLNHRIKNHRQYQSHDFWILLSYSLTQESAAERHWKRWTINSNPPAFQKELHLANETSDQIPSNLSESKGENARPQIPAIQNAIWGRIPLTFCWSGVTSA